MNPSIEHDVPTTASPTAAGETRASIDRRVFAILFALYLLVLYPILRANRYFDDDLKRALVGHTGWDSNGRPLTTLLMRLLQYYDPAMVDISPLTQVGAIAILAWAGMLIARRYAIRSPWLAALVAFPLGAQPFYMESLSYKFDALSMSVAMFLALLPTIALGGARRSWWLAVLALFASLCFYQPAINACLIFVLLELVLAQLYGRGVRRLALQFASRALQVGVAMLLYQVLVGIHIHGWVRQQSAKIHGVYDLPVVKNNIVDFLAFIGGSFNAQWWRYFAPVLVVLALFPVIVGIRHALKARLAQPPWVSVILIVVSLLMPLAALACVFGPMLLLLKPEIEPRVLMGAGALLSAALIVMQAALRQWRRSERWTLATAGMLALGMLTFASAYGNALGEQKSYEDRIASQLAEDLAELKVDHPIHALLLDGSIGYSPITAHVAEQIPLVRTLVIPYLQVDDVFHTHMFLMYYVPDVVDLRYEPGAADRQSQPARLARACRAPPARSTRFYDLSLVDDTAVVMLGAARRQRCTAAVAASPD